MASGSESVIKEDREFLGRDVPAARIEAIGSSGSYIVAKGGRKYLDFTMGWCVGNAGWGNRKILNAIKKFKGPAYVNPGYLYKRWSELARLLAGIAPGRLRKSFRATGGTEAVEIALQAARVTTGRKKFVSLEESYHGHSIGAMSLGSSWFSRKFGPLLEGCEKISPPFDYEAGRKVEKILSKEETAAFISEPIICNLGVAIPSKEFFEIVSDACKKHGTLLVMDEVATGFGRTGKMFACEHYNLKPDIMTLGKGITGGYGGIGATMTTPEVAKAMEFDFSFYSTFGWNPLNVEGAIANIKYLLKHRLWENAARMESFFKQELERIPFRKPFEVWGKGLALGLGFKGDSDYASRVVEKAFEGGLIVNYAGDGIITMFPALDIDEKTALKGLSILRKSA
jgi:acetylornithine/succinyldiaminopimelate/putrescine aminotransferase